MALNHALPNLLKGSNIPNTQQNQQQITPQQPPAPNVNAQNIPQPVNPVQPKVNPIEYLQKAGIKDKVDQLLQSGNSPEATAAALNIGNKGKKATGEIDPELLSVIEEYAKEKVSTNVPTDKMENVPIPKNETVSTSQENLPEEKPKLEKKMFVKTPKGVGEIREIRNGKALIDVDNKVQQFEESELEGSPFSEDDIADKYDSLMAHIPEAHKSSWIQFAQYDEKTNTLGFIPRGGTFEVLHDITPEEAKMIKEGSGVARTSGETKEGLWNIAESTKGGVVSQIIWDRKKKQAKQEEKQGKFSFVEGLEKPEKEKNKEILFEELQFPRTLSKERERQQKQAERERKRNEKIKRKK
jgi:hypothetical protein